MARFSGTNAAERYLGTDSADTVYGNGGNDSLAGGLGNDFLDGGLGNDWLGDPYAGDPGNDRMHGRQGDDQLFGGAGGDWLDGGSGNDTVKGGRGDDTLVGGTGDDWLIDTLRDDGSDIFLPGVGNDHMVSYRDSATDIFRFDVAPGGFGTDDISYFEAGIDRVEFRGFSAADLTVSTTATNTAFGFRDGSSLTVDAVGLVSGRDYVFT